MSGRRESAAFTPLETPPPPPTEGQPRPSPTVTPGPRGSLPASVPVGATRSQFDAARGALNDITGRTPEKSRYLSRPIAESDARQLGIPEGTDVAPPGVLMDLSRPAWVQRAVDDASDDDVRAAMMATMGHWRAYVPSWRHRRRTWT